jgi:transcription initiation factor IIE alpha subunit
VTPAQWRLARRVATLLADEIGLTDQDLTARLDVSMAELRQVLPVMYRQRRIDRCRSYTVLTPHVGEGRRAA